jgi:hypothetical protein
MRAVIFFNRRRFGLTICLLRPRRNRFDFALRRLRLPDRRRWWNFNDPRRVAR